MAQFDMSQLDITKQNVAVEKVLEIFRADGFDRATVIGEIVAGPSEVSVR